LLYKNDDFYVSYSPTHDNGTVVKITYSSADMYAKNQQTAASIDFIIMYAIFQNITCAAKR